MNFALIISPAKKMNLVEGPPWAKDYPELLDDTRLLAQALAQLSLEEAQRVWQCSDKLAELNYERHQHMDFERDTSAAVLAYEGIQYQHLAAGVLGEDALAWLGEHLRILSGFYGIVRPYDAIVAYRLEMQAKLACQGAKDVYAFWGDKLARTLARDFSLVVNCASKEYAKAVLPYAESCDFKVLTCTFAQMKAGKLRQASTEAKAARGSFVRWCAEHQVHSMHEMRAFGERGYQLKQELSSEHELVFVKT